MPHEETTRNRPSLRIEPLAKPVDRKADDATGVNVDDRKPIHPRLPEPVSHRDLFIPLFAKNAKNGPPGNLLQVRPKKHGWQ
jgi:hypothetical protein